MKNLFAASAAAAALMAGTALAAQTIDPICLTAAESQGLTEGYNISYDPEREACIATPLPGTPAAPGAAAPGVAAGALAGLGGGAGIAVGVGVLGVLGAAAASGGT